MPMNSANLILVCTWLSLAVAVIANPNAHAGRSLGHHAHPELVALSHLPPIVAKVDDSTGQIETVGLQKKKRAFGGKNAKRYYGDERGFTRPSALPTKRGTVLPAGWSSVGCVTEGQTARALQGLSYTSSTMTVNTCLEVCRGQGFNLAGLEWSDECYCGNSFAAGGGTTESSSSCNMACTGGSDETCGGYFVLSAYSYSAANATAVAECSAAVAGSSIIATATSLVSASASSSALPFGASSAVPSGFSASASASASGSASVNGSSVSASSFVASSTVSSSAAVPTASSTTSTEWEAIGCYVDNPNTNNGKNILQGTKLTGSSTMTQESCQTRCAGQGYNFAGLEYGDECWCGDLSTSDLSSLVSNSPWCNMPCTGNSAETCGGGWSLQLFEQVDVTDSSC